MLKKIIVLIILVVLFVIIYPFIKNPAPSLTLDSIKNIYLPGLGIISKVETENIKVKLVDGEFEKVTGGSIEYPIRFYASLYDATSSYVIADLDNNGLKDILFTIRSYAGGTGVNYDLFAFINEDGKPVYADKLNLGDRIKVNSISVENGIITSDIITQGPSEPICCGTLRQVKKYSFEDGRFNEIINK